MHVGILPEREMIASVLQRGPMGACQPRFRWGWGRNNADIYSACIPWTEHTVLDVWIWQREFRRLHSFSTFAQQLKIQNLMQALSCHSLQTLIYSSQRSCS